MARVKGITYGNDAFPRPYTEATANNTAVFDGSDNAAAYIAPLWGHNYMSSTGSSCDNGVSPPSPQCRNDISHMKNMGVELVRLYDWDPRNNHVPFLDHCAALGIDVIVSASNYFLNRANAPAMDQNINALIKSFTKGNDYHPAIVGVVFGNEFNENYGVDECIKFTQRWVGIEQTRFPTYRPIKIGHPLAFILVKDYPCWDVWDKLLPPLAAYKSRLFLAPQTYNDANYLFHDAESKGRGYVDVTWEKYQVPILFTEMGRCRVYPDHVEFVKGQLTGCIDYSRRNPEKLIGFCFFSFTDKVWAQGTSEGMFGTLTHSDKVLCNITYSAKDFTRSIGAKPIGTLNVDHLDATTLYAPVQGCYTGA
jgi:hypothetical protein